MPAHMHVAAQTELQTFLCPDTHKIMQTSTQTHSQAVLFLKPVNHQLNLVSLHFARRVGEKAARGGVRIWNCLHYMLQCFSNGLEHIKLKMNSRSSRHHVERLLSFHFPFPECSIITTAVTFIVCVCVCRCAYPGFVPYVWIYQHACVHLCMCVRACLPPTKQLCSVAPLQQVMCWDKGSHLPDSCWKGSLYLF